MIIGIIGGGQLGMMICQSAKLKGHKTICLDPNPLCSAAKFCDKVIVGPFNDVTKLKELGSLVDVLTYEFENIDASNLTYINEHFNLKAGTLPLYLSQNRLREKANALKCGLRPVPYFKVLTEADLIEGIKQLGLPVIYKTTTLGYDGHGQYFIKDINDISKIKLASEGILEKYLPFDYECSIIMIRDKDKIVSLPISKNIHKNGILDLSIVSKEEDIFKEIKKASYNFMIKSNIYGILCIEYFVKGNEFYFNEMAPRPHNSGHYSIEGCNLSQYDLLVRYLTDEKLEEPVLKYDTIMKNILSEDYDKLVLFENKDNVYIHDYYKRELKPRRKMAHITFTNLSYLDYKNKYKKIFEGEDNE